MDQVERIRSMEDVLQRAKQVCAALDEALDSFEALQDPVDALSAYYGSELWFHDLDCDRAGLLPADLPRGVLSEDEAYDLLSAWRELQSRMSGLSGAKEAPQAE